MTAIAALMHSFERQKFNDTKHRAVSLRQLSFLYVRACFRLMFAVYIFFTALVLVNLLIAMMTNSYQRARQHAKSICRFDGVTFGLRVERVVAGTMRAVRWLTRGRLCQLDGPDFLSRCRHDYIGRCVIDVEERTPTMTLSSEQVRLREQIFAAELSARRGPWVS